MIQTETWDTISAASRSNVQIYPVDPRGLTTHGAGRHRDRRACRRARYGLGPKQLLQELQTSQMNLRQLAEETGGVAFVGRNDFNEAFDRIVQENSSYYVLGYYSTNEKRDGKLRNISVRVAGYPDAQVTYRKRYAAPRGRAPQEHGGRQAARSGEEPDGRARQHAWRRRCRRPGMQLRVTAIAKKGAGKNADVEVLIDTLGKDLTFTEKNGTFNNQAVAVGRRVQQGREVDLRRTSGRRSEPAARDARARHAERRARPAASVAAARDATSCAWRRRTAARRSRAARTSISTCRTSRRTRSRISSVALAVDRRSVGVLAAEAGLRSVQRPSARAAVGASEFPNNSEIAAVVEVYDNKPTPTHRIDVTATVRADDGRVVFNNSEERSSEELHGTPGGFGYTGAHSDRRVDAGTLRARRSTRSRGSTTPTPVIPGHSVRGEVMERALPTGLKRCAQACIVSGLYVLLVPVFCVAAAAAQADVHHVAKGDMSGQQIAKQVTVRTAAEWKALWKDHAPTEKMPAVDFATHMVVGIFLGTKPSAGHEVEIVGVRTQDKDLIVEYVQKQPGRGTMAAQILTEPYHLVSVATTRGHRSDLFTCPTPRDSR